MATGAVWAIGQGAEGGTDNEATFVLVSSGSFDAGTVRFTVVFDEGTTEQKDYALPGMAQLMIRVGDDFPGAQGRTFSLLVESLTADVPITVEYSRYHFAVDGVLHGGSAGLAIRVR
jgi:hypothetical protein